MLKISGCRKKINAYVVIDIQGSQFPHKHIDRDVQLLIGIFGRWFQTSVISVPSWVEQVLDRIVIVTATTISASTSSVSPSESLSFQAVAKKVATFESMYQDESENVDLQECKNEK